MKELNPEMSKEEFHKIIKEEFVKQKESTIAVEKSRWENLKTFGKVSDVPKLPVVAEEEWKEYYVPKLIKAGAISKVHLIDGHFYEGDHRNARYAKWDQEKNVFLYWRQKFTSCFIDSCEHFEDYSHFAVFVPIKEIPESLFDSTDLNKKG